MNIPLDDTFSEKSKPEPKPLTIVIWAIIFISGWVLKFLDIPGFSLLFLLGSSGLIAYNLFYFIKLKGQNSLNNAFLILAAFWALLILLGLFYPSFRIFSFAGCIMHLVLTSILWGIYYLSDRERNKKH